MASLARCAAVARRSLTAKSFSTTSTFRKDHVQQLYLTQIQNYKPSQSAANAAGNVREYSAPSPPHAPQVPSAQDLSKELDQWESVPVGEVTTSEASEEKSHSVSEFLSHLEADHPEPAHH